MNNHISEHIARHIAKNWPKESIDRLKREIEKDQPARLREAIKNGK